MSFLELFHQPESAGPDKPHADAVTQFSDLCRQYAQASVSLKEAVTPYASQRLLAEDLQSTEEKAAKLQLLGSKPYQEKHRTKLQREEDETANHLKQIESAQQKLIDALISLQDFLRYKEHTDKLSFDTLLTKLKSIQDASQSYLETAVGTADSEEALALLASPAQQARITYAGALLGFTGTLIPKLENVVSLCAQAKTAVGTDAHAEYAVNYVDILDDVVAEQVGVNPMDAPAAPAKPNVPQIKK